MCEILGMHGIVKSLVLIKQSANAWLSISISSLNMTIYYHKVSYKKSLIISLRFAPQRFDIKTLFFN